MKEIRITLAQINTTVGDFGSNLEKCVESIRAARSFGSDMVVFPELTITGYPPEDLLLKRVFLDKNRETLKKFAAETKDITAIIGFVDGTGPIYNAAGIIHNGRIEKVYHKMFLPNYGVFDEKRYFTPGDKPLSFLLGDITLGITVCEDIWVNSGPHKTLFSDHNAEILINISASPFHAGKIHERSEMLSGLAKDGAGSIVYVNLVGGQDELVFDGGSMIFGRDGICAGRAAAFREQLYTADIPIYSDKGVNRFSSFSVTPLNLPKPGITAVSEKELSGDEEILEALVTGTRDYIRKNGFKKVVIGLSGGIDSSIVAAIAVRALGAENVIGMTMPSQYTSGETRSDAEILAANLGIKFMELPIAEPFEAFTGKLSGIFGDIPPDATEENIQARVRGIYLMALSNKFNWLVLTTGNKSETATGYCTLYGDMAGGFAVIKDVPKTTVYRISRLFNRQEGREIIPESVLVRPPTAELRPDQKDSDSLPEYDILDPILEAYVEDDMSLDEITALGFDRETVKKIIRLCDLNEYKRRQAPPGVKITHRAFGKDRRLPITNRFRDV